MPEITTSLSRAECVQRLSAILDPPIETSDVQPVVGWVNTRALRLRKRITGRNSFQTILTGRFSETLNGGVKIAFKTGMGLSVKIGMSLFGAIFLVSAVMSGFAGEWLGVFFGLGGVIFSACLVGFGQMIAKDEAIFLIDFLKRTVEANEG